MDEVISSYLMAFDELNTLTSTSYYQAAGQDLSARINQVTDDVLSFLIKAYTNGIEAASIMLACELEVDVAQMQDAIYEVIEGKIFADRVADHLLDNDLSGLQSLVESEYHRVYNAAIYDGAIDFTENGSFGVTKTWFTVGDQFVRDTHRYLEEQSIPIEEEFFTFDGDHAPYPGGFTMAKNNVNCRCIVKLSTDE